MSQPRRTRAVLLLCAALAGCAGEDDVAQSTAVNLTVTDSTISVSEVARFQVTADANPSTITSWRIDCDGDGAWESTIPHSNTQLTSTYGHRYPAAGTYVARVEVLLGHDVLGSAHATVTVTDP